MTWRTEDDELSFSPARNSHAWKVALLVSFPLRAVGSGHRPCLLKKRAEIKDAGYFARVLILEQ